MFFVLKILVLSALLGFKRLLITAEVYLASAASATFGPRGEHAKPRAGETAGSGGQSGIS